MTLDKDSSETGLNLREPQYAGWRDAEDTSARNFRREIAREERELLRQNQSEHEDLRARVAKLERDSEQREPVIKAASSMVEASRLMKVTIVTVAVLISVLTGAIQLFDRWMQK